MWYRWSFQIDFLQQSQQVKQLNQANPTKPMTLVVPQNTQTPNLWSRWWISCFSPQFQHWRWKNLTGLMQSQRHNKMKRNYAAVAATNSAPFISLFSDLGGGTRLQPSISVPRQSKTVNGKGFCRMGSCVSVWECDGRLRCLATSSHIVTVMVNLFLCSSKAMT